MYMQEIRIGKQVPAVKVKARIGCLLTYMNINILNGPLHIGTVTMLRCTIKFRGFNTRTRNSDVPVLQKTGTVTAANSRRFMHHFTPCRPFSVRYSFVPQINTRTARSP
jgi:hypothetical protein